MHTLFAIVLIVHGLITVAIAAGSFAPSGNIPNPNWLRWWPHQLGRSWLIPGIGWWGGLIWLVAGLLLVGAGLGVFGFIIPTTAWAPWAIGGTILSLVALLLYFHPYYVLAVLLNLGILWIALDTARGNTSPLTEGFGV